MSDKKRRPYRKNVGILLKRDDGLILMGERRGQPGAWQPPQGGVDKGESRKQAMWRELSEELGLSDPKSVCSILGRGPEVRYDFPASMTSRIAKKYAGQAQTFFLLRFSGEDSDFNLEADKHPEFQAIRWMKPADAVEILWSVKRPVLEETLSALAEHFQ